jgi:hypothetical protein
MKVGNVDIVVKELAELIKARGSMRRPKLRTANCTHTNMERVCGKGVDFYCDVCEKPLSNAIGVVYVCRRIEGVDVPTPFGEISNSVVLTDVDIAEQENDMPLRWQLQKIGLSESIIKQAEQGVYTEPQLQKLKRQKIEMNQTIQDKIQQEEINALAARLAAGEVLDGPSNNDGAPPTRNANGRQLVSQASNAGIRDRDIAKAPPANWAKGDPTCGFRACHHCRPYFKDRAFINIDSIVSDSTPSVTPAIAALLSVKSAHQLRNVGLRPYTPRPIPPPIILGTVEPASRWQNETTTPSSVSATTATSSTPLTRTDSSLSVATFQTTQTDLSILQNTRQPRRRFYMLDNRSSRSIMRNMLAYPTPFLRQGLRSTIKEIFKTKKQRENNDSSPIAMQDSSITLPIPRSGTARDLTTNERVAELDIGPLRRVRRAKEHVQSVEEVISCGFETQPRVSAGASITGVASSLHGQPYNMWNQQLAHGGTVSVVSRSATSTPSGSVGEGGEVEVDGGVALTEEAVETHTPDILELDTMAGAEEDEEEDTKGGDTDPEGDTYMVDADAIMAQV